MGKCWETIASWFHWNQEEVNAVSKMIIYLSLPKTRNLQPISKADFATSFLTVSCISNSAQRYSQKLFSSPKIRNQDDHLAEKVFYRASEGGRISLGPIALGKDVDPL